MSDQNQKTKKQQQSSSANVLEALKDIGSSTGKTLTQEAAAMPKDFMNQLFGRQSAGAGWGKSYSGELAPSGEIEMDRVFSGEQEKQDQLERQLSLERRLREEEKALFERKSNDLRLQLQAIMQEMQALAAATPQLAKEIEIAALQAPVDPGVYHVFFFEKLLEFLKSFRTKVEDASSWLHSVNQRSQKKNFWSQYKKMGGKRLLSQEDYSQRSAG